MGIVTQKVQSPPHTLIDGIPHRRCGEGRKARRAGSVECGQLKPLQPGPDGFPRNLAYTDGFALVCSACVEARRPQYVKTQGRALEFTKTEQVVIRGVGAVNVGWHGDAQYWPVKPLKRLLNIAWSHLSTAIKEDSLLASAVTYFVTTGLDGKQYEMICLPWSHWHTFWLKFGNADTLQVQQDAQQALERVFGHTAEQVQRQTAHARSEHRADMVPYAAPPADLVPVVRRLDTVESKLDQVLEWTSSVDKVQRTIRLRGGLYLARFRDEELSTPAALLAEYGIKDAAHWLSRGYMLVSIGKSSKDTSKRVAKHSGKLPVTLTKLEATFEIDDPDTGENYLRNNPPPYPIAYKVRQGALKDWFWLRRDVLDALKGTWPQYVTIADLTAHCRGWVFATMLHTYAQAELFT